MSLWSLPDELVLDIASYLPTSRSFWTCRRFYNIVIPILYKWPVVGSHSALCKFSRILREHPHYAAAVADLTIEPLKPDPEYARVTKGATVEDDLDDDAIANYDINSIRLPPLPNCVALSVSCTGWSEVFVLPVIEVFRWACLCPKLQRMVLHRVDDGNLMPQGDLPTDANFRMPKSLRHLDLDYLAILDYITPWPLLASGGGLHTLILNIPFDNHGFHGIEALGSSVVDLTLKSASLCDIDYNEPHGFIENLPRLFPKLQYLTWELQRPRMVRHPFMQLRRLVAIITVFNRMHYRALILRGFNKALSSNLFPVLEELVVSEPVYDDDTRTLCEAKGIKFDVGEVEKPQ